MGAHPPSRGVKVGMGSDFKRASDNCCRVVDLAQKIKAAKPWRPIFRSGLVPSVPDCFGQMYTGQICNLVKPMSPFQNLYSSYFWGVVVSNSHLLGRISIWRRLQERNLQMTIPYPLLQVQ